MDFLRKHIANELVIITLIATLSQIVTFSAYRANLQLQMQNKTAKSFAETIQIFHSPCNLENNLKKFEKAAEKESPEIKKTKNSDYFYFDETKRDLQKRLSYSLRIINKIKIRQIIVNNLSQRGPPQFI